MTTYRAWFAHDITLDESVTVGDAVRWNGEVWRVMQVRDEHEVFLELWGERHGAYPDRVYGTSA